MSLPLPPPLFSQTPHDWGLHNYPREGLDFQAMFVLCPPAFSHPGLGRGLWPKLAAGREYTGYVPTAQGPRFEIYCPRLLEAMATLAQSPLFTWSGIPEESRQKLQLLVIKMVRSYKWSFECDKPVHILSLHADAVGGNRRPGWTHESWIDQLRGWYTKYGFAGAQHEKVIE